MRFKCRLKTAVSYIQRNRVPSCTGTGYGEGSLGEFGVSSGIELRRCGTVGAVGGGTYRQRDVLVEERIDSGMCWWLGEQWQVGVLDNVLLFD